MRRSLFWKVAPLLVGAQVATALLAVVLSGALARERGRDLLVGTLRLRLDAVAEEVEARAEIGPLGEVALGDRLRRDLAARFPDPLAFVDESGRAVESFGASGGAPALPPEARAALAAGRIAVDVSEDSWGLAPVLAADGLPAGGLLVRPLAGTIAEETEAERAGFRRALWAGAALGALVALALGALLTWRLVQPVRTMTRRVETLGEGDYAARLPARGEDELGRLAAAINEMAGRVEASVVTLREADRVRRELVGNVGHDLRTPLAALRGYLDEAERLGAEGRTPEAWRAVAAARRQGEMVGALVADLFELSVLERPAGEVPLRLGPVPLGEVVRDAVAMQRPAYRASGVDLALDPAPGLPTLHADGARLLRLLGNLLDNARRHTEAGGAVTVRTRATPEAATVEVADTGEGISAADQGRVFERYYRGSDARTRGGGGTGLGLALARATARAHGGDLSVESALGEGSTFRLALPLAHPPAAPEATDPAANPAVS